MHICGRSSALIKCNYTQRPDIQISIVFVFWMWAPLGMAPEIEERARVPCHGQRIPLRIPKRISWTSRAALGPFHPRRIAPGAYPKRFQKHSAGCKVAWFKHTAPAPTEPPSLNGQGSSWRTMMPWAGSSKSWGASPTITLMR